MPQPVDPNPEPTKEPPRKAPGIVPPPPAEPPKPQPEEPNAPGYEEWAPPRKRELPSTPEAPIHEPGKPVDPFAS